MDVFEIDRLLTKGSEAVMEKRKGVILLYSGGLDSRLLLECLRSLKVPFKCLLIDYGQGHSFELEVAERVCQSYGLEYRLVKVQTPARSRLTTREENLYEGVSEWYVPGRNIMFIAQAAAYAETEGFDTIWYGANYDDRINLFPDCYQEWVVTMNELLKKSLSIDIQLEAPLLGVRKTTIQALANILHISEDEVHSGYGGA